MLFGGVLVVVLAASVEMRYMREFKQGVLGEFFHSRIQASPEVGVSCVGREQCSYVCGNQ